MDQHRQKNEARMLRVLRWVSSPQTRIDLAVAAMVLRDLRTVLQEFFESIIESGGQNRNSIMPFCSHTDSPAVRLLQSFFAKLGDDSDDYWTVVKDDSEQ